MRSGIYDTASHSVYDLVVSVTDMSDSEIALWYQPKGKNKASPGWRLTTTGFARSKFGKLDLLPSSNISTWLATAPKSYFSQFGYSHCSSDGLNNVKVFIP